MDPKDPNHVLTGGRQIVETTDGPNVTSPSTPPASTDWKTVENLGKSKKTKVKNQVSAIAVNGKNVYAGFCGGWDVVVGSKRHPDSVVSYPRFRRLQSWLYQVLIRVLFHLNVRDTQTGLKLFRGDVLRAVIPLLAIKRFAFDLELLVVARKLGFGRIVEAPVQLSYRFATTTNAAAAFHALWDTAAIFYRLHFVHHYDRRVRALKTDHARRRDDVPVVDRDRQ